MLSVPVEHTNWLEESRGGSRYQPKHGGGSQGAAPLSGEGRHSSGCCLLWSSERDSRDSMLNGFGLRCLLPSAAFVAGIDLETSAAGFSWENGLWYGWNECPTKSSPASSFEGGGGGGSWTLKAIWLAPAAAPTSSSSSPS